MIAGKSQKAFKPKVNLTDEQVRRFDHIVNNINYARRDFINQIMDRRRNLDDECGWPRDEPSAHEYKDLYDRFEIAARVVEIYPKESWQVTPTIYESEDPEVITPFEASWDSLGAQLRGKSWFAEEEGSVIWDYMIRADILSGIGQYGVILLGLGDGQPLNTEAKRRDKMPLLYMRAFPESLAPITSWETDKYNRRYGMPHTYQITFNDPKDRQSGLGVTTGTVDVHWSRIIHIADNLGSSEVLGVPRMRPVLNRLLDIRKLYGGSAEMYWKGAFPGLSIETLPQLGGDVDVDDDAVKDEMEGYFNGLQRYMRLTGMTAKTLTPTVVDPSPQIEKHIEAICIKGGYPVRIFKGSERGELASTQDDDAWNDRLKFRQLTHNTPRVIVPTVDRLIQVGVLPEPKESLKAEWPDLTSKSDNEKAEVGTKRTTAFAQYIAAGGPEYIAPVTYFTLFLGFSDEDALSLAESFPAASVGQVDPTPLPEANPSDSLPDTVNPEAPKEEDPPAAPVV